MCGGGGGGGDGKGQIEEEACKNNGLCNYKHSAIQSSLQHHGLDPPIIPYFSRETK